MTSAASSSGREVSGEGPMISRPDSPDAQIDDREWVKWGFANLTLPEALRRLRAVNLDRETRGKQPLGEPPFTGPSDSEHPAASVQDRPPNFRDDGQLFLVRCFACDGEHGKENHAFVVARGVCAWCGWKESA